MNGEALITIKDKNGNVKQQVKEKNLVFDIPKDLVRQYIVEADLGLGANNGYGSSGYSGSVSSGLAEITCYEDWFRAIKVNDEACSELDYKDWKMPVLFGGETARIQSNNQRYAYYDTVNSLKSDNVLKKVYTWNNCPEFTLKSINLCHYLNGASYNYFYNIPEYLAYCLNIVKYGKFYWTRGQSKNSNVKGIYGNQLCEKGTFDWALNTGRKKLNKVLNVTGHQTSSSDGTYHVESSITALKNNEIALLRNYENLTTDDTTNSSSSNVQYLYIIDASTGLEKRHFPLTQFDGFVGNSSSSHYIASSYVRIAATDFGSFIIMSKTNSSSNVFVWKIPEQSEMTNYSNNEPIAVYADLTSTGYYTSNNATLMINEFIILPNSTLTNCKTIRITNDPLNPYKVYDYVPYNIGSSTSSGYSNSFRNIVNKYYDITPGTESYSFETWYNTTVLNLSEGVPVSQGDTVTIEYTITAS